MTEMLIFVPVRRVMDRATCTDYSMCSVLFLLTFSSVYNLEFSTTVNVLVDHCILHSNYTAPVGNKTCSAYRYRVNLYTYTSENKETELSSTDTTDLKYSYSGINSSTHYRIKVTPALQCGSNTVFGEKNEKNITALAETSDQTFQVAEAKNISISCPFHGAYKSYTVIKWQQKFGTTGIVIRNFTTAWVNLVNISYQDSGMYYCTVGYYPCGYSSHGLMHKEGRVSVNFKGPPVIASVMRTIEGDNIHLSVQAVSFPQPPNQTITLTNKNGHRVEVNSSGFVSVVFPYTAYGHRVNVSGYQTQITIRNISTEWLGEIKVFVTNTYGTQEYTVTTTRSERENKKTPGIEAFFNDNKLLVYGAGAGLILLFIFGITVFIVYDVRRKKKRARRFRVNSIQDDDVDSRTPVDELYSRPFSNKLYEDTEDGFIKGTVPDREKRIQMERMQIASTYSFGGFSLGEFDYEEAAYGNDCGNNYNNIMPETLS